MSIRTVIEINHDYLSHMDADLLGLLLALRGSGITTQLNKAGGPVPYLHLGTGITVLAQRHHSETLNLEVR